ncbi:hypothetical protein NDU88_001214 [Pleurodeles waltl]|uniref:Uncharacterized protein n=1 Tax=Pleurodeles waltl TaxID=8319 RepID=A0AAV7WL98_PLEWA|nr:hypothetical protein NDU88_001214 [Pleurodeles waltl]
MAVLGSCGAPGSDKTERRLPRAARTRIWPGARGSAARRAPVSGGADLLRALPRRGGAWTQEPAWGGGPEETVPQQN